jgi:hypothetical protein
MRPVVRKFDVGFFASVRRGPRRCIGAGVGRAIGWRHGGLMFRVSLGRHDRDVEVRYIDDF